MVKIKERRGEDSFWQRFTDEIEMEGERDGEGEKGGGRDVYCLKIEP